MPCMHVFVVPSLHEVVGGLEPLTLSVPVWYSACSAPFAVHSELRGALDGVQSGNPLDQGVLIVKQVPESGNRCWSRWKIFKELTSPATLLQHPGLLADWIDGEKNNFSTNQLASQPAGQKPGSTGIETDVPEKRKNNTYADRAGNSTSHQAFIWTQGA